MVQPTQKGIVFPDIKVEELMAYKIDKELQDALHEQIYKKNYLPMVVETSPLLCYIMRKEWTNRYTDSIKTISLLHQIINCYGYPGLEFFDTNMERIKKAQDDYIKQAEKIDAKLFAMVKEIEGNLKTKSINEKEAITEFIKIMEQTTITRINLLEQRILRMFNVDEALFTPQSRPEFQNLPQEDQKRAGEVLCEFYKSKQWYRNDFDGTPEVKWFDLADIPKRREKCLPDELFRGYLDRFTMWEYLKFCC